MASLVNEHNPLPFEGYHDTVADDSYQHPYTLADVAADGGRITRLRLLTDPGCPWYDVSYCHATLADGTVVNVDLRGGQFTRRGIVRELVALAKEEGVYAKGIGLLDRGNWSILY